MIWLGLFLPLLGFLFIVATSSFIGRKNAGYVACTMLFLSFLCFLKLLWDYNHSGAIGYTEILYHWIPLKGIQADFAVHIDALSLLMTMIITGVGFLIHVYSIGYMEHEEDVPRYFAFLNFFVFAMLLLVLAANLLLLFVGWEGVGLASYLLIGFWYQKPEAAQAATKAFVVNRIGDCGLLVGLLLTFTLFGTSDVNALSSQVKTGFAVGAPILSLLTLLYFIGATGKSAQLPLHTWLPDAMEGPTPVSALIHAATMVTAGVYLVVRLHEVYQLTPQVLEIIGIVGAVGSLFASLCAMGQTDLKRVLAYSTMSQLGLMFLACGVGAYYAAMFHLTTHAFIKALLFLSAGNVLHLMEGATDMNKMGGLAKVIPKTHWLFVIGVIALSGIPPFAAFFSKDLILDQTDNTGHVILYVIGLAASILTAFYLTRAYFLTFRGESHVEPRILAHAHDVPSVMIAPVSILAFLSIVGGYLGYAFGKTPVLQYFLGEVGVTLAHETDGTLFTPETIVAVIGAFIGMGAAAVIYSQFSDKIGRTWGILRKSFYIDEVYEALIVNPLKGVACVTAYFFEPKISDGSLYLTENVADGVARRLQWLESGQIRSYVAWMVVGSALLIAYFVF